MSLQMYIHYVEVHLLDITMGLGGLIIGATFSSRRSRSTRATGCPVQVCMVASDKQLCEHTHQPGQGDSSHVKQVGNQAWPRLCMPAAHTPQNTPYPGGSIHV
jgi:hypothetical protein